MAKQKGVKSLAETVNADEIVISDEEVGTVNFIATVSENTEEQIKNYIKSQKEK